MSELLDEGAVATALEALPDWRAHDNKLVRTVQVPADSQDAFEASVMKVADQMNHHPEVQRSDDYVELQLWTHSAGGVTTKDVDLAARIDQVLSGAGDDQGPPST